MDNIRLKLEYDFTCERPFMRIVYQDEQLRVHHPDRTVSFHVDKWMVRSASCPAISLDSYFLWLRGEDTEMDERQAWGWEKGRKIPEGVMERIRSLAAAVAKINKRKNVVTLGGAGFIY